MLPINWQQPFFLSSLLSTTFFHFFFLLVILLSPNYFHNYSHVSLSVDYHHPTHVLLIIDLLRPAHYRQLTNISYIEVIEVQILITLFAGRNKRKYKWEKDQIFNISKSFDIIKWQGDHSSWSYISKAATFTKEKNLINVSSLSMSRSVDKRIENLPHVIIFIRSFVLVVIDIELWKLRSEISQFLDYEKYVFSFPIDVRMSRFARSRRWTSQLTQ